MRKQSIHAALASLAALGAALGPSIGLAQPAATVWVRSIPLKLAQEAANAALNACEKQGAHPSVGVMDVFGDMKVMLIGDNASMLSQKALPKTMYLALMLPSSTATVYARPEPFGPPEIGPSSGVFDRIAPGKTLDAPGSIPIKVGAVVVGAIGVSGSPTGAMDDACAQAGIAKIADRLK